MSDSDSVEVIVKYTGDIKALGDELDTPTEVLNSSYAIMVIKPEILKTLQLYPQVEYIEYSSKITLVDLSTMNSSCTSDVHNDPGFNLNGKGVLIAILDSGIDFKHSDFINDDGTTRILRIWDQGINEGNHPEGFNIGTEYTDVEINKALTDDNFTIPHTDDNGHGTGVAGVAAGNGRASKGQNLGAAPEASLIIVKLAANQTSFFTSTANIMRAVTYVMNYAIEVEMPIVINISYGNSQGSHDGESLFEQFLDSMCDTWKSSIVVATGNEGIARHHFGGQALVDKPVDASFILKRGLTNAAITFCKNFIDIFSFQILSSSGEETQKINLRVSSQALYLSNIEILVMVMQPTPYFDEQTITFLFRGLGNKPIPEDIWTIRIEATSIIDGKFDIWLPVTEISGSETKFLNPDSQITLTIPSTAYKVISVGGYDSINGNIADFSGKGPSRNGEMKPDLVAPAIGVTVPSHGNSYNSLNGTSFAAPHVTGACALLMQWGIINGNDLYMYNQRLKSFLRLGATRQTGQMYPNPVWGYGTLCTRESLNMASQYSIVNDSSLLNTLYYDSLISSSVPTSVQEDNPNLNSQINNSTDLNSNLNEEKIDSNQNTDQPQNQIKNDSSYDLPPIYITDPIDSNLERRMGVRMQFQKNELNEKINPVLDESYIDYLIKYDAPSEQILRQIPTIIISSVLQGNYAIAHVPLETQNFYESIFGNQVFAEKTMVCALVEDSQAMLASGITAVKNQAFLNLSGQGVLVAVIDTGIDFTNKCFINEDGSTQIISIWDQSIQGNPPEGFVYGTEYLQSQIEEQIKDPKSNIVLSKDENGHGTFVASIMAANSSNDLFEGVAPNSKIIAVKLKNAKKITCDQNAIYDENLKVYQSTDISAGIEYVFRKAVIMKMPCVINISLGSNSGAHDSLSFFERYISGLALTNGVAIIAAVGNEGNKSHHFETILVSSSQSSDIEFNVAGGEKGFIINIWTRAPDRTSISLITPLGNVVERRVFTTNEIQSYNFVLEGTKINIEYVFPDVKNGNQNIVIKFVTPTPGLWTLKIYGDLILDGRIGGWLSVSPLIKEGTAFLNAQVESTITIPSTAVNSIATGAFNSRDGSIYVASGRGPALSSKIAPDFVAPGVEVQGLYPNNKLGVFTGTSAASAITTGAAALLMEWGIVEENDRAMNTLKVKSYLTLGCTQKKEGMTYPNGLWGYGTLNLIETFQRIR